VPTFVYKARKKNGEKVEGTLASPDRRVALADLDRMGLVPVLVQETGVAAAAAKPAEKKARFTWRRGRARLGTRQLLVFTTELSDLLASGMTLGNALNTLANRRSGQEGEGAILSELRDEIVRGSSLSDAMARHPETFSDLYVSMIRAGEASGAMAEVLQRLVTHYERVQEVKEKVTMALVYPGIVIVMGTATLIFSLVYVVPKFKIIFEQMEQTLPLPTRMLITGSSLLARYGWIVAILIGIAVVLGRRSLKTERGRLAMDTFYLRVPLVRSIAANGIYANFARTLATLLANGVPVLQALGIVERTVGNKVISNEIHTARDRVTDGTTISGPLAAGGVFPVMMTDMLAVGEQTGDMSGALTHIARRYENELDRSVKVFTTALEPILIVVVAIMVGFVAVSILMAVFNLTSGLNV
jgi:type IV pilus assembly protein PilC